MVNLFHKNRSARVEFCDRCGSVCDHRCAANALRERALDQGFRAGPRPL